MADFGDDAGQQVYDWMFRLAMTRLTSSGLTGSERALRQATDKLTAALEAARDSLRDPASAEVEADRMPEWAKLDMAEFQELEDFESVRGAIDAKLDEAKLAHAFYQEGDKTFLLFRTQDAPAVADAFDGLAASAREAAERAAKQLRLEHEKAHSKGKSKAAGRDEEPLEERAQRAREASAAIADEKAPERELGRADKGRPERSK